MANDETMREQVPVDDDDAASGVHERGPVTGMRQFAHDVSSLAGAISMATAMIDEAVRVGRLPPRELTTDVRHSAKFLSELFESVRNGTSGDLIRFDLWAVCAHFALDREKIVLHRNDSTMQVYGSRLDATCLLGALVDNAREYGEFTTIKGSPNAMVISNDLASGQGTRTTRPSHVRGTGLHSAVEIVGRLGLTLVTRRDENSFTATLTLKSHA